MKCFLRLVLSNGIVFLALLGFGWNGTGVASTVSYSGTLTSPQDVFQTTITLFAPGTIALQTWGFGGGTNAAGALIPGGGFDPLVALFSGAGPTATLVDGTSDILTNFSPYAGCPPAGTVTIGNTVANCGDVQMSFLLAAGDYTILLSYALYYPNAVSSGGTLSDGFTDFTGGSLAFQTCVDMKNCIDDTANWALDVTTTDQSAAPEPATVGLAGLSLIGLALAARRAESAARPTKTGKKP